MLEIFVGTLSETCQFEVCKVYGWVLMNVIAPLSISLTFLELNVELNVNRKLASISTILNRCPKVVQI